MAYFLRKNNVRRNERRDDLTSGVVNSYRVNGNAELMPVRTAAGRRRGAIGRVPDTVWGDAAGNGNVADNAFDRKELKAAANGSGVKNRAFNGTAGRASLNAVPNPAWRMGDAVGMRAASGSNFAYGYEPEDNDQYDYGSEGYSSGNDVYDYGADSFRDAYERMVSILESYGIPFELPSYDELYKQLEALLRPSVDAAINSRKRYGDAVLAELDADAYSRGMGGSSYLTGMKAREYDDIASDIASLEAGYTSNIAEYIYKATNELSKLQSEFAEIMLRDALERERQAYSGNTGSGSKSNSKKNNDGDENDAEQEGNGSDSFNEYKAYIELLSSEERHELFYSNDDYWKTMRSRMLGSLSEDEYRMLRSIYGGGDGTGSRNDGHTGGEKYWAQILS